jgi:hypothetical protein
MLNLCSQPFLLSLRHAAQQTDNLDDFETVLLEKQYEFKKYLDDFYHSEKNATHRFEFLKTADYQLCSIRLMCADKMMEKDERFHRFWSKLILDTRRYIAIGIDTLNFQKNYPEDYATEAPKTFPAYKWTGSRNDLTEAMRCC